MQLRAEETRFSEPANNAAVAAAAAAAGIKVVGVQMCLIALNVRLCFHA